MQDPFSTFVSLFLLLSSAQSLRLPFQKRAFTRAALSSSSKSSFSFAALSQRQSIATDDVNDVQDVRYVANITINGVEVPVALDTGSTDLWVIPPDGLGNFNDTGIQLSIGYGDGSYGPSGTIGVAPFEFGPYRIEKQAFLNAKSSTMSDIQEIGVYGLMGLGFDFTDVSIINGNIQSIYGPDATWGRSVLKNIFAQNPSEPNSLALLLARTGDLEDTDGGSFMIGEYLTQYSSIFDQPKLFQFPKGSDRWTVLMDGMYVDGTALSVVSSSTGVPPGKAQALLDTGNPVVQLSTDLYDSIYSRIPGSVLYDGDGGRLWAIPCNTTTNLEVSFAGVRYPVHPLDLSTIVGPFISNGQQYIACVSAFLNTDGLNSSSSGFDIALGDSFLRNVYSIFNFGDDFTNSEINDPFIQLLSTLDPAKAISEVATIRGQTLANLPPEMDPATYVAMKMATSSSTDALAASPTRGGGAAAASQTVTLSHGSSPHAGQKPTPSHSPSAPAGQKPTLSHGSNDPAGRKPTPSHAISTLGSNDAQPKLNLINANGDGGAGQSIPVDGSLVDKYGIVIVGLLAANLFVTLVLVFFGVMFYMRRGSSLKKNGRRGIINSPGAPVYAPVKGVEADEGYEFSRVNLQHYST